MCIGPFAPKPPKAQQIVTPDPIVVAPPPEPTPAAPIQESAGEDVGRKSRGTRSLRISLNVANPSGTGINVPGGA